MAPRSFHAARRLVFLFLLAFPLAACDCSNSSSTRGKACSDKSDCSGSEVCTAGTCQLPTDGATSDGSTGGDSGIGRAVALDCADHGATLVLFGRVDTRLSAVYDVL